ncbi:MAG: hypothetical protein K1X65_01220 [Caldilineales bacterium]|nr:hypothetical protein [Caldilineales bacterium]MCW5857280.1 hypothetical protein [Caldilineales bacterium]
MIQAQSNRPTFSSLRPIGARVTDRALRTRPQQALLAILLLAGVTAVLCLYLFQASRITVTTYGITHLQRDYARLQRENSNLLARYAYEQSLAEMKKRALAAGFGPVAELDYVAVRAAPAGESSQTSPPQEAP